MGIAQWKRADYIVELLISADSDGRDLEESRGQIKKATEEKFKWCHDCLLLAVYGFYKNGILKNTPRPKLNSADMTGFNGNYSKDIRHAFDALALLEVDGSLTAAELKSQLGGEQSIYSFVVHYYKSGLIA